MSATEDLEQQRRALREGALIQPMPELGALSVTGADRQTWLNGMVTCDLAPLGPGRGAYGLSVQKTGKILAELWIVLAADRLWIGALRERIPLIHEVFERHLIMEDAEIADASAEAGWIFAHGARAADLVASGRAAGAEAAAVDWTGLGGALFVAPREAEQAVLAALLAAPQTRAATAGAWDVLRVEHVVPRFGVDFDDQSYPQEAAIEDRAVSFTKGCYLGQETVFMLQMRGHAKQRLVQLAVEGADDVPAGAEIALPDGAAVGRVTSRVANPGAPGLLALGVVKHKLAAVGTALRVAGRPAQVVAARRAP